MKTLGNVLMTLLLWLLYAIAGLLALAYALWIFGGFISFIDF